jgi:hypothetical protein
MARQRGSRTGRCRGCNHLERQRIERLLAAGASIKGTARKFDIDYHALRRHWINHVSPEARAGYIAGAGATGPSASDDRCGQLWRRASEVSTFQRTNGGLGADRALRPSSETN